MSKKRAKPRARKKGRADITVEQVVVTSAPAKESVVRMRRQSTRLPERHLIETSLYKVADLEGVKKEWSDRMLLPGLSRGYHPSSKAVSYKPTNNVVAIGIGEKYVGGKPTGVLAVKFLLRSKQDRNMLLPKDLLPRKVRGLPVDVEQVGTLRACSNGMPVPTIVIRPARPGCSVGFQPPPGRPAEVGTFGALVRRGNTLFILSNNHVLADENKDALLGGPIFQPAVLDDANFGSHQIARLTEFAELLRGSPNKVDCAIAEVLSPGLVSNSILNIGAPSGTVAPFVGMPVHKFGRSSKFTVGSVSLVAADARLEYDTGIFMFKDQIIIRSATNDAFCEKGDSGSLVVERGTQRAVGLLIGRASDGRSGIANPINAVLSKMNVTLA